MDSSVLAILVREAANVIREVIKRQPHSTPVMYGDKIAILACNARYVNAAIDTDTSIAARVEWIKAWEEFVIVRSSDPYVSQKGHPVKYNDRIGFHAFNRRYVGVDYNHGAQLTALAPKLKGWEEFKIVPIDKRASHAILQYGNSFALQASNGNYVQMELNKDCKLVANVPHIKDWETYVAVRPTESK